ncbi:MAG: type I glyceraldehyde-3-phosphate dehydrogenase [Planctomycetota bacterium]|nr:MAG: type I glyceraldehyde-3-phosphate dehydrogenase [Planctomycetota bacterium]
MALRVAINGFGRIGRLVFRAMRGREGIEVAAINDLSTPAALAHLLKYDSIHGRFAGEVGYDETGITVDGRHITVYAERDPGALPWRELGIDIAIEATGVFRSPDKLKLHLQAGAKKVVLTAPAKGDVDATIVLGVNDGILSPSHDIISNASCTTNCLAPVVKVLHEEFGIERGFMNTVHAYTNDQRILDQIHNDLRRARAAAMSIIPTTTGAAKAVTKVIPALAGKLDGLAMRVPVPDGSVVDFTAILSRDVTKDEMDAAFRSWSEGPLKGILEFCDEPIVGADIVGNTSSSVYDSLASMAMGNLVKVVSWYDNEWAYSVRVADLTEKVGEVNDLG